MSWSDRLAERLVDLAAARLRSRHPDWAAAMLSETAAVPSAQRLGWAIGCLRASFSAPGVHDALVYPAASSQAWRRPRCTSGAPTRAPSP